MLLSLPLSPDQDGVTFLAVNVLLHASKQGSACAVPFTV